VSAPSNYRSSSPSKKRPSRCSAHCPLGPTRIGRRYFARHGVATAWPWTRRSSAPIASSAVDAQPACTADRPSLPARHAACACPGPGDPAAAANGFSFVVMRGWSTRGSSLYHSGSPTQPSRSAQSSMNSTRGATRTDRDTQDAKLNGRYTNTERKGEDKRQSGASQWEARRPSRLGVVHTHLGHVELHVVKLIPATTQVCDRGTGGGRGGDEPRELDSSSA
jgi:hypothetical protein